MGINCNLQLFPLKLELILYVLLRSRYAVFGDYLIIYSSKLNQTLIHRRRLARIATGSSKDNKMGPRMLVVLENMSTNPLKSVFHLS